MVNGLYTSAASMMHLQKKQDIASNNMANVNTTGFKISTLLTKTAIAHGRNDELKLHQDEDQNLDEVRINFSQGPLIQTDNDLDIAISGDAFFAIRTEDGLRYTRNGTFMLNNYEEMVNLHGDPVLKESTDSVHLAGDKLTVISDGSLFVDGNKVGTIGLYEFENINLLIPRGNGLYENIDPQNNEPVQSQTAVVRQGFLEGSNVDLVGTMVTMISQYRNYEASQKTMHAVDETIDKAVNQIGVVT